MRVLKSDSTNGRGLRTVVDGDLSLLQGFNCNDNASMSSTLSAPISAAVNRTTGEVSLTLQPFVPSVMITSPDGSTHFRLTAAAAAVNFAGETYSLDVAESSRLPINDAPTAAISLTANMPAASTDPIFLLVGIDFTQEVNGTHYALKTGAFNVLSIVQVDLA